MSAPIYTFALRCRYPQSGLPYNNLFLIENINTFFQSFHGIAHPHGLRQRAHQSAVKGINLAARQQSVVVIGHNLSDARRMLFGDIIDVIMSGTVFGGGNLKILVGLDIVHIHCLVGIAALVEHKVHILVRRTDGVGLVIPFHAVDGLLVGHLISWPVGAVAQCIP